ncbi:MAG: permease-like cell division protein FtsX [Candidatus Howiella sp.]|jgi:cell division transport system permease protein
MKLRSLRYLAGEGVKSIWVNRLMSLASVGVLVACMLLIGVAIALSANIDVALGNLEQQNVVMVYFKDEAAVQYGAASVSSAASDASLSDSGSSGTASDASSLDAGDSSLSSSETSAEASETTGAEDVLTEEEARALCDKIVAIPNVASVEFISSAEGLSRMLDTMDDVQANYFTWLEEDNPLSHGAKVTMSDLSQFDQTVAAIESIKGVDEVYHQRDLAVKITTLKNGISIAGVWIVGLLLVIALVIVSNTIRVTMYSRKLEISIMKAVGATNAFIRTPFVVEGVVIGLLSAGITSGLLYFVYRAVIDAIRDGLNMVSVVPFRDFAWQVFGLFAAIGVLAGLLGSSIMISKYLRKEGSEFRAL